MPRTALFVWLPGESGGRNVHVYFRRHFSLRGDPKEAALQLFADSSYHLRVNGQVVGCGPAAEPCGCAGRLRAFAWAANNRAARGTTVPRAIAVFSPGLWRPSSTCISG